MILAFIEAKLAVRVILPVRVLLDPIPGHGLTLARIGWGVMAPMSFSGMAAERQGGLR